MEYRHFSHRSAYFLPTLAAICILLALVFVLSSGDVPGQMTAEEVTVEALN